MAKRKKHQSCGSGLAWDVDMEKCMPEGQAKKPAKQPPGGRKTFTGDLTKAALKLGLIKKVGLVKKKKKK